MGKPSHDTPDHEPPETHPPPGGPFSYDSDGQGGYYVLASGKVLCEVRGDSRDARRAIARRLAACLAACEGIPTTTVWGPRSVADQRPPLQLGLDDAQARTAIRETCELENLR